jgi:hypothetical protein
MYIKMVLLGMVVTGLWIMFYGMSVSNGMRRMGNNLR